MISSERIRSIFKRSKKSHTESQREFSAIFIYLIKGMNFCLFLIYFFDIMERALMERALMDCRLRLKNDTVTIVTYSCRAFNSVHFDGKNVNF